jgi:hypothetical protein
MPKNGAKMAILPEIDDFGTASQQAGTAFGGAFTVCIFYGFLYIFKKNCRRIISKN